MSTIESQDKHPSSLVPQEKHEKSSRPAAPPSVRVVGKKMRDEFLCPITFELMVDPVIASDGHTYERSAIEKWLRSSPSNPLSPLSGEPITTNLLPNINLRKLIQDMCSEGGASLYTNDTENLSAPRTLELIRSSHLIFECLGPPESDWNQYTFLVSPQGCRGGRSHNVDTTQSQKELFLFKDITISRKHFEIYYEPDAEQKYKFRDLGSAGGSYVRIPTNNQRVLENDTIIMIGKHQFSVSFRDMSDASTDVSNPDTPPFPSFRSEYDKDDERYKDNTLDFSGISISDKEKKKDNQDESEPRLILQEHKSKTSHENKVCVLKCTHPEGSPFLNQEFIISPKGASIGRKTSNDIPLARQNKDDKFIDNAVSAEHARIDFNHSTQQYYIIDGASTGTPSTNGTWIRLSAVQKVSPPISVYNGMELLVGTVRFKVREVNSIIERPVD